MRTHITNYLRAGHLGLYLVSGEEARNEAELKVIAATLNYKLCSWSVVRVRQSEATEDLRARRGAFRG